MTQLSVNLNKVALIRNARDGARPDVSALGAICLDAGASGLTLHPRPDGRHARAQDASDLRAMTRSAGKELNIEGNPFEGPQHSGGYDFPGFMQLVLTVRPDQVTLVPDVWGQITSDHGWNLSHDGERLRPIIRTFRDAGCRVSVFVDPGAEAVRLAKALGADRIELYTGPYAQAFCVETSTDVFVPYRAAAFAAVEVGIGLNAGHDLDLTNLAPFLQEVPGVLEVSIGQALVADALELGFKSAVRAYLAEIDRAHDR